MSCSDMERVFREDAEIVKIYLGKETIQDPFEQNVTVSFQNPIPIEAIISTVSPEKAVWKIYGIKVMEAKDLIVRDKHISLFRLSQKVTIDGNEFYPYKDATVNFTIMPLREGFSRITIWRVE